jgi:uncharacterized protein (DUF488 family)
VTLAQRCRLYTIGHSNHSAEQLIGLLRQHGIMTVADVRSSPYSRYTPHFNRELLGPMLGENGIDYVYMGSELGARPGDAPCNREGRVDFRRLRDSVPFTQGLKRLGDLCRQRRVAVLCAEKDPLDCHRMILVCRALRTAGLQIRHIHADGRAESHEDAERRLVHSVGVERTLFEPDLTDRELLERAYDIQAGRIAYGGEVPQTARQSGG